MVAVIPSFLVWLSLDLIRIKELLAKIGVSLHDSQQPYVVVLTVMMDISLIYLTSYHFLSTQIRMDLPRRLDEVSETFGLEDLYYDSFTRRYGRYSY